MSEPPKFIVYEGTFERLPPEHWIHIPWWASWCGPLRRWCTKRKKAALPLK